MNKRHRLGTNDDREILITNIMEGVELSTAHKKRTRESAWKKQSQGHERWKTWRSTRDGDSRHSSYKATG